MSAQAYGTPTSAMAAARVRTPDPLAEFEGESKFPWKLNTKNTTKLKLYTTMTLG